MASASPSYIPRFCPTLQAEIIFVRKKSGVYSKFIFDAGTGQFKPTHCTDCHLDASEKQLFPFYSVWSHRLSRYVIFAENKISEKTEQFVYSQSAKRFEQVDEPELVFNPARVQQSNTLFTVGGATNEGVTVILRGPKGYFRKEQYNLASNQYEVLPPVPVLFLSACSVQSVPVTIHLPVPRINDLLGESIPKRLPQKPAHGGEQFRDVVYWLKTSDFECDKDHEYSEIHTPTGSNLSSPSSNHPPQIPEYDASKIRRIAQAMGNSPDDCSEDSSDFVLV